MIAPVRREAVEIREEWLGVALSTRPADRPAAEAAISELYRLIGLSPPRFHWVSSPLVAMEVVPPGVRHSESVERMGDWAAPRRFAALVDELCRELDTPGPLEYVIRDTVRRPLAQSADSVLFSQLQAAYESRHRQWRRWYEPQSVAWIAHYDALRRLGVAAFTPEQDRRLDLWAAATASCGWWWPREDVCTVSERPAALHTEVWGTHGEVRLHHADGPAVRYPDGWELHSWHGTRVPAWVITDPAPWRVTQETNVEVRRCAIERIGWPAYVDGADLRLLATAPDPGNPGFELRLYDMRRETRLLLAVNGSVERDGHRRRYGLTVPGYLNDPLEAAGWTYGLSAEQYSLLVRRT